MPSDNIYADHRASLITFMGQFAKPVWKAFNTTFTLVDLDAYDDDENFPPGDLVGIAGYAIDVDEHLITVTALFGIATDQDLNHFRLNDALGSLLTLLLPTKKIPVLDRNLGSILGTMTIQNGVRAMPITGGVNRPTLWIAASLSSNVTLSL